MWRMRALALLGFVFLLAACRADVVVDVVVDEDGSGVVTVTVTVDEEAVSEIIDLKGQLRAADLTDAGWTLAEPEELSDGGMRFMATKEVPSAEQFGEVLAEVHPVVFADTELELRRTFGSTRYVWTSTVDRTVDVTDFGDPDLAPLLDGFLFGVPLDVLRGRAGGPLDEAVTMTFTLTMFNGSVTTLDAATMNQPDADVVEVVVTARDEEALAERDRAESYRNAVPLLAAAVGVWTLFVVGGVWVWRRRRRSSVG